MRARFQGCLVVLALVLGAACLGYLGTRHTWTADWSAGQRASLSDASRAVLRRLHGPVAITSYARPGARQRARIAAFIDRYRRFKSDINLEFIDPSLDPAATRQAGITVNGELVVRYHGHRRYLRRIDERHLTNALESLARGGTQLIAFVTGDGERNPAGTQPADLGDFVRQLETRGVRALPLNFAQVAQVPEGTRLVVLASPLTALSDAGVRALTGYVADGGNLLWLSDPGNSSLGLAPLADALGVDKLPGMLMDAPGGNHGDPRVLRVDHYPHQSITQGFHQGTRFRQVAALARSQMGSWQVKPILRSGAHSWIRTGATDASAPDQAGHGDIKGPLDFGLALTRLSPGPGHKQQRVVVIGDGDFLSNAFLGKAGNRALGERIFNWLLGDDALIGVPPRHATSAPLVLSQAGLNRFAAVFLVGVPLVLVLIGAGLGWRRRRR